MDYASINPEFAYDWQLQQLFSQIVSVLSLIHNS